MAEEPIPIGLLMVGWKDSHGKIRTDYDASKSIQCLYVNKEFIYLVQQTRVGGVAFFIAAVAGTLATLIQLFKLDDDAGFKIASLVLFLLAGASGWVWLLALLGRKKLNSRSKLEESVNNGKAIRLDVTHIQRIIPPKWKHPLKRMPAEIHFLDRILVLGFWKRQFMKMLPFLPSDRLDETK